MLAGAVLWSFGGLLIRWIQADEVTTIFWRSVFATVFLGIYTGLMDKRYGNVVAKIIGLGAAGYFVALCFSADTILFIYALKRTTIANAVVIFATTPIIAALLAKVFLGERLYPRTWVALSLSTLGIAWMVSASFGRETLQGDLMAMVIAVLFAVPIVIIRKYPTIDVVSAVLVSALVTACICMPFAQFQGVRGADMWLLVLFGVFEYGVALVIFSLGAKLIPAAQSSLLGLLEVILAPLWVWIFVNEAPSGRTLSGGLLVLLTLVGFTLRSAQATDRERNTKHSETAAAGEHPSA